MKKKNIEEFISKAREVHKDYYDYSKAVYCGALKKICVICPEHGEFWITPANHLSGQGCKICGIIERSKKRKKSIEQFIKESRTVHGDKYDYSKVEYYNIDKKVCIICPEHGEFWQTPYHHLNGCGCPKCVGQGKTTEDVVEEFKKIHGDKYDYSKVEYTNSLKKVCIICPEHGEFWQSPTNHLNGCGCPKCSNVKHKTTNEFIKESRTVHGDKYDYSKVEYVNAHTKVCIICPEHGEFWQTPADNLNGHGCRKCSRKYLSDKNSVENSLLFIKKANAVHGDKYDYSKVEYVNAHTKVCSICPEHGEFWQTPNKHLLGHKCPKCSESIIEKEIRVLLDKEGIKYVKEKRFNWMKTYRLDFYLPDYNIGIECQGIQHFTELKPYYKDFSLDKQLERDEDKFQLCLTNGVSILYFTLKSHFNFREISEIYNNNLYYDKYQLLEKITRKKQLHL